MGDLLDLVLAHDVAERSPASQVSEEKPKGPNAEVRCSFPRFRAMSIKGMVGSGRHGADSDRKLLCFHMRTQKQSRSLHTKLNAVATKLHGSTFKKSGKTFKVHIKQAKKGSGIVLALDSVASKGNRYVRAIAFSKFLEASFSPSCCNIAVAARLEVHPSSIPRLQKTCASLSMCAQGKFLAQLLLSCRNDPPLVAMRPFEHEEHESKENHFFKTHSSLSTF